MYGKCENILALSDKPVFYIVLAHCHPFICCYPCDSADEYAKWIEIHLIYSAGGASDVFKDHCNKTVDIYEDVASPEVTNANRGRPITCVYRFRSFRGTPRDWVLRLRFKKFKVGTLVNATYCEGGFLQVS